MHELSIAMDLIAAAQQEAEQRQLHPTALHVKVGVLSGVVKEALISAYEIAACDSPLAGTALVIEDVPVVIYCENCGRDREIAGAQNFRCPQCESPAARIVAGRELELVAFEVD